MLSSIEAIRSVHEAAGGCWFDPLTMRHFASRVSGTVFPVPGGAYFVSSERFRDCPRRYTVHHCSAAGRIETIGEFQEFATRRAALARAEYLAAQESSQ